MQELGPDAIVEADAARDVLDVGIDRLAQVGDLVDEADLDRQEGVRGIFRQLGRPPPVIRIGARLRNNGR